jgi:GTP-binding protein EngB required for normal cell division
LNDARRVQRVAEIAAAIGAIRLREEALAFAERIDAERVYVAFVGQFKRGKTSLINALLGEPLLPAGVLPVTAVPVVVRYGPQRRAVAHHQDGAAETVPIAVLADYVSEDRNPHNRRGVEALEVFLPHGMLAGGLCVIDTPGLGSALRASAALTRSLVPRLDAAIVVIGVDPPLAGDELDLVEDIARQTAHVAVVLNKADRFGDAERRTARAYARSAIAERLGRPVPPILEVSAFERAAGGSPTRDWPALEAELERLVGARRPQIVDSAWRRGAQRLVRQCIGEIIAQARATFRPLSEAEDLAAGVNHAIGLASLEWLLLKQRAARDGTEESRLLRVHRDAFLAEATARISAEVPRTIAAAPVRRAELRDFGLRWARERADTALEAWFQRDCPEARARAQSVLAALVTAAQGAIGAFNHVLQEAGYEAVDAPPLAVELEPGNDCGPAILQDSTLDEQPTVPKRPRLTERITSRRRAARAVGVEATRAFQARFTAGSDRALRVLADDLARLVARVLDTVDRGHQDALERGERTMKAARQAREAGRDAADRLLNRLAALRREAESLLEERE